MTSGPTIADTAGSSGDGRSRATHVARRFARIVGSALIVVGCLVVGWGTLTWLWQDPVTATYTHWQQDRLSRHYDEIVATFSLRDRPALPTARSGAGDRPGRAAEPLAATARNYRESTASGAPVGRLVVPRLGLNVVVVNGTDTGSLRKGPGRDPRTAMPGEGRLTYIAGHRTTFGAPFAHIDSLRVGDPIRIDLPYATFHYRVTGHSIVPASDLTVLRSRGHEELALQACHPRFFATERYLVWASLTKVEVGRRPGGGGAKPPSSP